MGRRKQDVQLHVNQRQPRKRGIEINIIKQRYFDIAVVGKLCSSLRSLADFDLKFRMAFPCKHQKARKKTVTVSETSYFENPLSRLAQRPSVLATSSA